MKILDDAAERLRAAGIESPRMEARLLLGHALSAATEDIIAGRVSLSAEALAEFETALLRRIVHEPIAYITGEREFWSLPFIVDRNVLIPRPETETLVEAALRQFPDARAPLKVLDLGTGSGCILLAFLSERREARGLGVDSSAGAISVAARNAQALHLSDRAQFLTRNWHDISESFDVVFANPPYIKTCDLALLPPDVLAYEPEIALDGGADGLDAYRSLASVLPRFLGPNARAYIEIGQGQAESVATIFRAAGLEIEGLVNDLSYIPRCLVVAVGAQSPQVKLKKGMEKEKRSG